MPSPFSDFSHWYVTTAPSRVEPPVVNDPAAGAIGVEFVGCVVIVIVLKTVSATAFVYEGVTAVDVSNLQRY